MRIEAMKSLGFNEIGEKIDDQTPISNTFIEASKEFEQLKIIIISKLQLGSFPLYAMHRPTGI